MRFLPALILLLALAACGDPQAAPQPKPFDPHQSLLPIACREHVKGACGACVQTCCAICHEGSECILFRACMQSCQGNFECIGSCARSHPDGNADWLVLEDCVDFDCAEACEPAG